MRFFLNRVVAPFIIFPFLKLFNRLEITGLENIPLTGPAIIIGNHKSMWDPVILYCLIKRGVCFMAKTELFKVPLVGYAISKIGSFPVKRDAVDRNALRMATKVLEKGDLLGIFPEGHRNPDGAMLEFKSGAALFACRAKAMVIPVLFENTYNIFPRTFRPVVRVTIGAPLDLSEYYNQKLRAEILENMTDAFKTAILALSSNESPASGRSR